MADEKAKIVTDATGPGSGPAPAQPEVDAQVSKQEQSAPEAPTPDIAAMASAAIKTVSKNAGRIFLPFRLHTILPAFAVLFNSGGRPVFPGGFILTYFGFLIRAKSF